MLRFVKILMALLLVSAVLAHQGFNQLSWRESADAYTISILEDFHVNNRGEGLAQVVVQISEGKEAAPTGTALHLTLSMDGQTIYQGPVPPLGNSSADGQTFYTSYVFTQELEQAGWYDLTVDISGPLGTVERSYLVQSQQGTRIVWLAYLPYLIILLICTAGVVLLFVPLPAVMRKEAYEKAS